MKTSNIFKILQRFQSFVTEMFRIKVVSKFPSLSHITQGFRRLRADPLPELNFSLYFSTNLGVPPPPLSLFFPFLPLLSPRSAFEDGACCESAWLALDTKGGLFHEMFPFLMSDGVRSFNIPH